MGPVSVLLVRASAAVVLLALLCAERACACSCLPAHPQEHACRADFVIVARVKKHFAKEGVFKVAVKREFQMSEKASLAIKSGRLLTSPQASTCGVHLVVDETYLIAGRVVSGKPWISLCSFIRPWKEVTSRQRKGFRLLYKLGCSQCQVVSCPWWRRCSAAARDECHWTPLSDGGATDCQASNSVCAKHPGGRCAWTQDKAYKACVKLH